MVAQELMWRFRVMFEGKLSPKTYLSPDVRSADPGWGDEVFGRRIEKLEFFLPTGHKIVIAGMEQYNFFVEVSVDISGAGRKKLDAIFLAGKIPNKLIVDMWRIGNKKAVRIQKPWGQEWGGQPTRGWKQGIVSDTCISMVMEA